MKQEFCRGADRRRGDRWLPGRAVHAAAQSGPAHSDRVLLRHRPLPPVRHGRRGDHFDEIRDRYKDAIRFLELAVAGKVSLGGMPGGETAPTGNGVVFAPGSKVFGRDGGAYRCWPIRSRN